MPNIELVGLLCDRIDARIAADPALAAKFKDCPASHGRRCRDLMTFVTDRPGHDRRYAICADKLFNELGFRARISLAEGMARTVDWYINGEAWWQPIQSGAYRDWMKQQYGAAH
jgi:dTDP-glucose 4,6-dehydratase